MSFGKWYEEKKNDDNEGTTSSSSSSSWFNIEDSMQLLPTFDPNSIPSVDLQGFSYANMKASMEQQMPQKIFGLNYQQRFQVRASEYSRSSKTNLFILYSQPSVRYLRSQIIMVSSLFFSYF